MNPIDHRDAFSVLDRLDDDALHAIVGAEWVFEEANVKGEEMFLQVRLSRAREAIEHGRERVREFTDEARSAICLAWQKQHARKTLEKTECLFLVFDVISRLAGVDPGIVGPVTLLICRGVNYRLDSMCGQVAR